MNKPLTPVYPFADPGTSVELHNGDVEVAGESSRGRAEWHLDGRRVITWTCDGGAPLGEVEVSFERPGFGRVRIPGLTTNTDGEGDLWGEVEWSSGAELVRAVTHWPNMPLLAPSEPLQRESRWWTGRTVVQGAGWVLTLDAREDLRAALDVATRHSLSFISHTGELVRQDGSPFAANEAKKALVDFQIAVSFALGRWSAPALPVGYDASGTVAWEQWANWRCSPPGGVMSWWDGAASDDLQALISIYMGTEATDQHEVARHLMRTSIASNHPSTTVEARIMLAQSGLEYLWWVRNVLSGRVDADSRHPHWHDRLRSLLAEASVDTAIPGHLHGLQEFGAAECLDGPEAIARVRNRLVHPRDAGEPYRIQMLVADSWLLTMEYLDLMTLHTLGYAGTYGPRVPGRWRGDQVRVPWAAQPATTPPACSAP